MACKEGQFDVVDLKVNDQFKTFSINLNAQHVNGMTPSLVRLLDTVRRCDDGGIALLRLLMILLQLLF